MNKKVIIILVLALTALPVFSSNFGLVFNINYNIGSSDFFDRNETIFQSSGYNFLESKRNKMGMGFNAGIIVPVTSRLSVLPSFSINFGHQSYEFSNQESVSDSDINVNYSFLIFSGKVNVQYDLFVLKNGWRITAMLGANHNSFQADGDSGLKDTKYWGAEAGIGTKFFQVENFGFQTFLVYKYPFSEENYRYLTLQAGIIYKF